MSPQHPRTPVIDEVAHAHRELIDALVAGDTHALAVRVADTCQIIGPKGFQISKDEWVSTHSSQVYQQVALDQLHSEVHRYVTTVVRCDLQHSECIFQGEVITGLYRVLSVWVQAARGWQLVAIQYTSVSPDAATNLAATTTRPVTRTEDPT